MVSFPSIHVCHIAYVPIMHAAHCPQPGTNGGILAALGFHPGQSPPRIPTRRGELLVQGWWAARCFFNIRESIAYANKSSMRTFSLWSSIWTCLLYAMKMRDPFSVAVALFKVKAPKASAWNHGMFHFTSFLENQMVTIQQIFWGFEIRLRI